MKQKNKKTVEVIYVIVGLLIAIPYITLKLKGTMINVVQTCWDAYLILTLIILAYRALYSLFLKKV
jgi:hypothetical protein